MTVHRIKSYSVESGYVYQYCFAESRPAERSRAGAGIGFSSTSPNWWRRPFARWLSQLVADKYVEGLENVR